MWKLTSKPKTKPEPPAPEPVAPTKLLYCAKYGCNSFAIPRNAHTAGSPDGKIWYHLCEMHEAERQAKRTKEQAS